MSNQFELYLEITSLFRSEDYNQDDLPQLFILMEQIHSNLSEVCEKNLLTLKYNKCDTNSYLSDIGGNCDCNKQDIADAGRSRASAVER
tara:strand:- start:71 stop:337 length:267 start_codon:yes stop_codon:yes gene_type:complete